MLDPWITSIWQVHKTTFSSSHINCEIVLCNLKISYLRVNSYLEPISCAFNSIMYKDDGFIKVQQRVQWILLNTGPMHGEMFNHR